MSADALYRNTEIRRSSRVELASHLFGTSDPAMSRVVAHNIYCERCGMPTRATLDSSLWSGKVDYQDPAACASLDPAGLQPRNNSTPLVFVETLSVFLRAEAWRRSSIGNPRSTASDAISLSTKLKCLPEPGRPDNVSDKLQYFETTPDHRKSQ
jgi:hypothetical protein